MGLTVLVWAQPATASVIFVPIGGAGSTWAQNAVDQWRRNVTQFGMQVNYTGTGSSNGRNQFRNGTVDFAVSDVPYGLTDEGVVDPPPPRPFSYLPLAGGGTSFMYNLTVGGRRVTNLRLSGDTITKIFTGVITNWSDPAIHADNPGLVLPSRTIVPVVRSDVSGTTFQLTSWMSKQHPSLWNAYCARAGLLADPCGAVQAYPVIPGSGFSAFPGSLGVTGYVAQSSSDGAITYAEYSYAVSTGFPVVKLLNSAGYYVAPTATNAAIALLAARVDSDPASPTYLTQLLDGVYTSPDPRAYPLSSYSYLIAPTSLSLGFTTDKGQTLGAFAYYALCRGQQIAPILGYAPLPVNLVRPGLEQIRRLPGVDPSTITIAGCANPTFSPDGTDLLASTAPLPAPCDRLGPVQCPAGTQPTVTALSASVGPVDPSGPPTQPTLVTATATVTPASGTGTPTGSVQFLDGGVAFGSPVTLADGAATLTTTGFGPGTHLLSAVYSGDPAFESSTSETVPIRVEGPATAQETVTTTVPAGALLLTVRGTDVTLPDLQLTADNTLLTTSGAMNPVTVIDTRAGDPGWSVSGQVSDFTATTGSGATINGFDLGWTPSIISHAATQTVTAGSTVAPAPGLAPGVVPTDPTQGLKTARTLATATAGAGIGTAEMTAVLALAAPTSTPAGQYTAALTLTAI